MNASQPKSVADLVPGMVDQIRERMIANQPPPFDHNVRPPEKLGESVADQCMRLSPCQPFDPAPLIALHQRRTELQRARFWASGWIYASEAYLSHKITTRLAKATARLLNATKP